MHGINLGFRTCLEFKVAGLRDEDFFVFTRFYVFEVEGVRVYRAYSSIEGF